MQQEYPFKVSELEAEVQKLKLENQQNQTKLRRVQEENNSMKSAIKTLITVAKVSETFECTICLDDIEDNDQIVFSPCGHRQASTIVIYKTVILISPVDAGRLNFRFEAKQDAAEIVLIH